MAELNVRPAFTDWLPDHRTQIRMLAGRCAAAVLGIAALVALAGALGYLTVTDSWLAIVLAAAVLAVGVIAADITMMPLLAFPAVLISVRTGPVSFTDLVLIAALLPAMLLVHRREAADLQPLIWLGIVYHAMLVPTLLLNPYFANLLEWAHELVMVIGGMVVGWVVGRRGRANLALGLYVGGSSLIGVWAFLEGLYLLATEGAFGPVTLPYLHKNFIGNALVFAFLIAFLRPDWLGWTRRFAYLNLAACLAGIAASGSRQAMVSLAVVLLVMSLKKKEGGGGRGRVLLLAAVPGMWFVYNSVSDQLEEYAAGDRFNSAAQRLLWFAKSLEIWQDSPVFGVGLRWWYTNRHDELFQPPNAIFEMLSSSGLVGTLAFLILTCGGLWVLLTIDPRYGNLAIALLVARLVQGQLDLYWVAGMSTLPWMVAGLVYGVQARHRETEAHSRVAADTPY